MNVVAITDSHRKVIEPQWLVRAEVIHRQLRPLLPTDYAARMNEIFVSGGEMLVAVSADAVCGVAVFRVIEKTFSGRELYCDDLVTDEAMRSTGVGKRLLDRMKAIAAERACDHFTLDSGCQRQRAHAFYFREGMAITSFHFGIAMK